VNRLRGVQPASILGRNRDFSLLSKCPYRHLAPAHPPVTWDFFFRGLNNGDVKLSTPLYLVCRLRMRGAIHSLPIRLHGWRLI